MARNVNMMTAPYNPPRHIRRAQATGPNIMRAMRAMVQSGDA